jgi:hypothetical protein
MLDIAKECHVTDRQLVIGYTSKHLARVEDPFVTTVTKEQDSTLMECWKDNDERAKHLLAPGSIDVGLAERAFTWTAMSHIVPDIGMKEDQMRTVDV